MATTRSPRVVKNLTNFIKGHNMNKTLLVLVLIPISSNKTNTDVMTPNKFGATSSSGVVSNDYRDNYDRIFNSKKSDSMDIN